MDAKAGAGTELGNNHKYSAHFVSLQRLSAAHALRSDQKNAVNSGHFVLLQRLRAAHTLRSDQNL